MSEALKKLILHIGHGKTGTSALQAFLARSHEKLKEHSILYPHHPSFAKAERGHISCGNIAVNPEDPIWVKDIINILDTESDYNTYIFSGESMFGDLDRLIAEYKEIKTKADLTVFLSVRNPLDMLASEYQQNVKRGGETCSFKEFVKSRNYICVHTKKASELAQAMKAQDIEFKLFNYSHYGQDISQTLLTAMRVPISFESGEIGIVNRSHTNSELLVIRIINALLGKTTGMRISDGLVNDLPSLKAEFPNLDGYSQDQVIKHMGDCVKVLNSFLPSEMPLSLKEPTYHENKCADVILDLSTEQLELARLKINSSLYPKGSAQVLRSISDKYFTKEGINQQEASALLEIAKRVNPKSSRAIQRQIDKLTG